MTGAGTGLGRAYALDLAARGARVVVNDAGVDVDGRGAAGERAELVAETIRARGGQAIANPDTIATAAGVARLFRAVTDAFGQVDILVNNAGIVRRGRIAEMDDEDWDAVLDVHLRGTFLCTRAALRRMHAGAAGGRIINITSGAGFASPYAGTGNYAAAKAGVIALTQVTAREEAESGITCNAVAPLARTRMSHEFLGTDNDPSLAAKAVAPFISFLASDAARTITGQLFRVGRGTIDVVGPRAARAVGEMGETDWDALVLRIKEEMTVDHLDTTNM